MFFYYLVLLNSLMAIVSSTNKILSGKSGKNMVSEKTKSD